MPRRPLRRLAEIAVALVLALAVLEVGARLFLRLPPRGTPFDPALLEEIDVGPPHHRVRALRPGGEATDRYPGLGGEFREIPYRVNADGFRDRPYPREREPGTFRIAVIGDSIAFGTGIDAEDTAAKILEELLAARVASPRVEVMNCGVYNTNTREQVAHLRARVLPFQPDLVLLLATVTDASGTGVARAPGEANERWETRWSRRLGLTSGRWDPDVEQDPARRRAMWVREKSALADYVANRAFEWLSGRIWVDGYLADWQRGTTGWTLVHDALVEAKVLSVRRGFELHVALYPLLTQLDDYPLHEVTRSLAAICAELDVPFTDLYPALAGLDARSLHAHAHDRHPNARANRLVAELLADELAPRFAAPRTAEAQ